MAESRKQNFEELREPSLAHRASRIFDDSILPIDRMKLMDAHEFEELTAIWILHSKNCANVCTIGGSKDGGRDIVAYYASTSGDFDIYQCKHYSNPMTPSVYCVEFGKLCYYTWIEKYRISI